FTASLVAASVAAPGELTPVAMAVLAAAVVAVAVRVPVRWGATPAAVAGVVAGLAATPLVGSLLVLVGTAGEVASRPWVDGADAEVRALAERIGATGSAGPLALHLLALGALVVAAAPALGRRGTALGLGVTGAGTVLAAPLLLSLSVGGAAAVALSAATGSVVVAGRHGGRRPVLLIGAGVAAASGAISALWAAGAPATSLSVAAGLAVVAVALVGIALRDRDPVVAVPASMVAVLATSTSAGLAAHQLGADGSVPVVVGACAALASGLLGVQVLDPAGRRTDLAGVTCTTVELAAWAVHLWAILALTVGGEHRAVAAVLASGVLAAGLHATRPGRRGLAAVAGVEGLALCWLHLGQAGVTAPEPYVLPVALLLAGSGAWAERRAAAAGEVLPSWVTLGPALVVGLAPTVVVGLGDTGLVRPLAGLVAGAMVLVAGAATHQRAAVDVGTAVVVLLGLRQLAPVVGELPNWATLGATGLALLAVGATFEQRRRDLHDVQDRYRSLR
ncbi:MAG TPA: hypothetical protein VHK88_02860, partial [Aquihabitans sp.]|nr:hypothetical protein [Aquihabitans sp.]